MPRFVILEHDWPTLHWDFLLESGLVLRAWRLLAEPTLGKEVLAEQNTDHRPLYLDYEGPLSDNRGCVRCWDKGTFDWIANDPERLEVALCGEKLQCHCAAARDAHGRLSAKFFMVPTA